MGGLEQQMQLYEDGDPCRKTVSLPIISNLNWPLESYSTPVTLKYSCYARRMIFGSFLYIDYRTVNKDQVQFPKTICNYSSFSREKNSEVLFVKNHSKISYYG